MFLRRTEAEGSGRRRDRSRTTHVHEFTPDEGPACRMEGLEPQHWPGDALDGAMVLSSSTVLDLHSPWER